MGSIQHQGKSRWRARYRGVDNKQYSKTFKREIDAREWLVAEEHSKTRGDWLDPRRGKIKFAEWAEKWQAMQPADRRASTMDRDERYIRNHIIPAFGRLPLAAIEPVFVQEWVSTLGKTRHPQRSTRPISCSLRR